MDREALRARLMERCGEAVEAAMTAVESAGPEGIISGSEWAVKEAFQGLTKECFGALVQARVEEIERRPCAAAPPSGRRGRRGRPAIQRPSA